MGSYFTVLCLVPLTYKDDFLLKKRARRLADITCIFCLVLSESRAGIQCISLKKKSLKIPVGKFIPA